MEGTRISSFRLVRRLGAGGMGSVWYAEPAAGLPVAVKILHPHVVEQPGFLARFRREAEIGSRVRHENVVRTLEAGETDVGGRLVHYLVMEYVEGETLRRLLADLGFVPDGLLRAIARQVAAGLAAIHEAGVVHRDMKPENVLITREDRVRIMDLGVARLLQEAAALTKQDEFAGSLPYASPEQFGRGDIGPASDLYSLGVMLYELATGVNPFARDGFLRTMAAHLEETPAAPADRSPEVSRFLSEIVTRLIAKSAPERFPSARVLVTVFETAEGGPWWAARERELAAAARRRPRLPVARETPLRGRAAELAGLGEAWTRATAGHGLVAVVEGGPGIGKTRLIDAFLDTLAQPGVQALYGSCSRGSGLSALTSAVTGLLSGAGLPDSLPELLAETPALVPGFLALLRGEAPPAGTVLPEGDALAAGFAALLRGLAARGPLVWVVDDLDAAEPEVRRAVLSLARAVEGRPAFLLLAADAGTLEDEVASLSRGAGLRVFALDRLSPREVFDLVRDQVGNEALAERLGGKIAWKSDGVPLFALEIVRALRESGALARSASGAWVETHEIREVEIPSSVQDLVRSRFRDLEEEERAILDVASCAGLEFDAELVAEALDLKVVLVLRRLAHLERRRRLVRSQGENYRFDHRGVRDALYAEIPPRLRREYHASLAAAIRARLSPPLPGAGLAALTRHLVLGGRLEEALPHVDAALDHLEGTYANDAALDLIGLLLAAADSVPPAVRIDLLLRRASRLNLLGRRDEQRAALEEASALASGAGDHLRLSRARRQTGAFLLATAKYADAAGALAEALDLARSAGAHRDEALTLANLAVLSTFRARYAEAAERFGEALVRAREAADPRLVAVALRNLGTAVQTLGRYDEAEAAFTEAGAVARRLRDPRLEAAAAGALGGLRYLRGDKDEALRQLSLQSRLAREVGDRNLELEAATGLAAVAFALGRLGEALASSARSRDVAREIASRDAEARALVSIGAARLALGELAEGRAAIEEAEAIAAEIGSPWLAAYAGHWKGLATEAAGGSAAPLFTEVLASQRGMANDAGVADALAALGRSLVLAGRHEEARAPLLEAIEIAERSDLPDPALLAAVYLVGPPGGTLADAEEAFRRHGPRADRLTVLEARFRLHRAGSTEGHLAEARRVLADIVGHAPLEMREKMLRAVPLYRDVLDDA